MNPHRKNSRVKLSAVDLFAGGGGLTVGLKRAGFDVIAAVENEQEAYSTYKTNHPEVCSYLQDVRTVKGKELLTSMPGERLDLLAGCPPCQGFSSLTSKYKKKDPRNDLIHEMTRLVRETLPRAIMMENVPGLSKRGWPLFNEFISELSGLGYRFNWEILQVADFGVPQNRRRLVVLAGLGFEISMPKPTHSKGGKNGLPRWRTLRDIISEMSRPINLKKANTTGGPLRYGWHVIRSVTPVTKLRLIASKPGASRRQLPDELRPVCHKGKNNGFSNVYGRMSWDGPSVTITGGCTTYSKGRFGHPSENRTISVREAALIQTFPRDYIFNTPYMDYACNIVGNALPCHFAKIISLQVRDEILNYKRTESKLNDTNETSFGRLSRSELMSKVRSKGNKTTELKLLGLLKVANIKGWRRHYKIIGKPDFAWPKLKIAVFVDGCFWHGHECGRNLNPKTNEEFWKKKVLKNKKRDRSAAIALRKKGWSVVRIWECQLKKDADFCITRIKRVLTKRQNTIA